MTTNLKIMGVIPARFNSSRLPGKALREIAGKPMIHWVYQNAKRSPLLTDLLPSRRTAPKSRPPAKRLGIPVVADRRTPLGRRTDCTKSCFARMATSMSTFRAMSRL